MAKPARKVATRKARSAHPKKVSKRTGKVAAKLRNNVAAETVRQTHRVADAQFNRFTGSQVSETLRGFAEQNVAQTRELFEHSKSTFQTVLESWQKSFGAAGQNAIALNRRMIDVAERNMDTSFDLAMRLAGARNLTEVMEVQAAYWRKLAGIMQTQVERATSAKARAPNRNR